MRPLQLVFNERAVRPGIDVTKRYIPTDVFGRVGIPLIVACTRCGMTLPIREGYVEDSGYTDCADCAGVRGGISA
jgi:hypothetical protein